MMQALKLEKENKKRLALADAEKIGNKLLALVKTFPGVQHAELAGSLRRRKETIGDIDLIITAHEKDRKKIISKFTNMPGIEKVIAILTCLFLIAPKKRRVYIIILSSFHSVFAYVAIQGIHFNQAFIYAIFFIFYF